VLTLIPVLVVTNLPPASRFATLTVTTLFMALSTGRWVPAMAMVTASTLPRFRGRFMSVNSSVQHMAAGLASLVAGFIISKEPTGPLHGFPVIGYLAVAVSVVGIVLAGYLRPADELG
jgi:predicted MFS family arabinose efflux permease